MARISFLSSLLFFITALVSSTSMMVMAFTVSPLPTSSSLATSSFAHRTVEQTYGNTPSTGKYRPHNTNLNISINIEIR